MKEVLKCFVNELYGLLNMDLFSFLYCIAPEMFNT